MPWWTVWLGCSLWQPEPEPMPLALPACADPVALAGGEAEAPGTLDSSATAGPRVSAVHPVHSPTAVRLPDGLHALPQAPDLSFDDAAASPAIEGGLLLCRLEEGVSPRFRMRVGDQPPIEGASPLPRVLTVAPATLAAADRVELEVMEGDEVLARADGRFTPGRGVSLRGRQLRAECRTISRDALQDPVQAALARLDEARARACGPVSDPGPTEAALLQTDLRVQEEQVAALAGWDDPRLVARRPGLDALQRDLRDVVRRRVEESLGSAADPGSRVDLVGRSASVALTRTISCGRRLPPGTPRAVRCSVEVDILHERGDAVPLVGGWNLRLGDAIEVALVDGDGTPHPVTSATFRQDGRAVRGEILRLAKDEGALAELWIDLDTEPLDAGPPLLRLSDGSRTTWLLTR